MKKRYIPFFLLLSALCSCNNKPTDHFVLRGTIPGATDSTEIVLSPAGKYSQKIAQGFIVNGKFELQGKVDQPTYCRLSMNDQDILDRSDSDVYKRQGKHAGKSIARHVDKKTSRRSFLQRIEEQHRTQSEPQSKMGKDELLQRGFTTVSYTHLDVYKRQ